jgi:hypothetical protein
MTGWPRPTFVGYLRADVLQTGVDVRRAEERLYAFAEREAFNLGTVYVEHGPTCDAFTTLMDAVSRDEAARGVVVPDLRHLTLLERLVLSRHECGAMTPVITAGFPPRPGGPGARFPEERGC